MALSAIPYAQADNTAGGKVTAGAGSMRVPIEKENKPPDVTRSAVGEARSGPPTGRSDRGLANGLNMGTRSGANSDVNKSRNGLKESGQ
jgi:hypothetical protein